MGINLSCTNWPLLTLLALDKLNSDNRNTNLYFMFFFTYFYSDCNRPYVEDSLPPLVLILIVFFVSLSRPLVSRCPSYRPLTSLLFKLKSSKYVIYTSTFHVHSIFWFYLNSNQQTWTIQKILNLVTEGERE